MILRGENISNQKNTCTFATLSTTLPTWTGLGLIPGLGWISFILSAHEWQCCILNVHCREHIIEYTYNMLQQVSKM
jgi:hypothetical protein